MPSKLTSAAIGALALGGENNGDRHQSSPDETLFQMDDKGTFSEALPTCPAAKKAAKFHYPEACMEKPSQPSQGHPDRRATYLRLRESGTGATLVPNQQTVTCPEEIQSLEIPFSVKGFDTTWIVENTSTKHVMIAWVVNGEELSPFTPDLKAREDPKALLKVGEWTSVPTFDSFVYHVREYKGNGEMGPIVMQHRAGMVPLGHPNQLECDPTAPDVEPVTSNTGKRKDDFARTPTHKERACNTVDIGFRNQVGCPLHVYWANLLGDSSVPPQGFSCHEKWKFHLGTKPATQDFMSDWESSTKFEGSMIGHTFVARLASNPNVVVDSYTVETTKVIDCPVRKPQTVASAERNEGTAEVVLGAEGMVEPDHSVGDLRGHDARSADVVSGLGTGSLS